MTTVIEIAESLSADVKHALRLLDYCGFFTPRNGDPVDMALLPMSRMQGELCLVTAERNPDDNGDYYFIYRPTELGRRVADFLSQEERHGGCSG